MAETDELQCGFCPISHIPLHELQMAVVFKGEPKTVYDADHVVRWLRDYMPKNPMTNESVAVGCRFNEILIPIQLPHMSVFDHISTAKYLKRQGRLWSRVDSGHFMNGFGFCMCLTIWVSGFYGLLFVAECTVEALESNNASFTCLVAPMLLFFVQMTCVLTMCWLFPEVRAYAAVRLAVCMTLLCMSVIHASSWVLRLYATPEETSRWIADALTRHRGWLRFVVHPRMLGLLERVMVFLD